MSQEHALTPNSIRNLLKLATLVISVVASSVFPISVSQAAVKYVQVGAGALHSCGLSADGDVYCWGNNEVGQMGQGKVGEAVLIPTKVPGLPKVASISVGVTHTCAVTKSGLAFCWGDNTYGKIGSGLSEQAYTPVQVKGLSGLAQVSANRFGSCAVSTANKAFCWGDNTYGVIGDGTTNSSNSPVAVTGSIQFKSIRTSNFHTCAIAIDNSLYCWGDNTNGQLGIADLNSTLTPQKVTVAGKVSHLTVGAGHTCSIGEDGIATCWGYGEKGQVGDGGANTATPPTVLKSLGKLLAIEGARFHTCALNTKYETYCWGAGDVGQLGNGKTSNSASPVAVLNLKNTRSLGQASSFSASTCVLDSAGAYHCWGDGQAGQLGNGDRSTLSAPLSASSSSTGADTSSPTSGVDMSIVIKCKSGNKVTEVKGKAPKCPSGFTQVKEVKPKSVFYLDMKEGCYSQNFPATSQVVRSGANYKTMYPASCTGRYHFQTIFAGTMKTASSNGLPTQAEASDFCGQKYIAAMGQSAPSKISENATYLYWFFADAGFEAKKYPGRIICNLIKTDMTYTYLIAQTKPMSRSAT